MKLQNSIIWQGQSPIDNAPIAVVAIVKSSNRKTGNMVQTYIIRSDISPTAAIKSGLDVSVCFDCKHRGDGTGKKRTCYVNVGQGALAVYKALQRGKYPVATDIAALGAGRIVRLGTYGDPAAVPVWVWQELTKNCTAHTGYTHQFANFPELRTLCMASVDSEEELQFAHKLGWRTFRVALPHHTEYLPKEARCPASKEAGQLMQCDSCRACNGTATGRKGSIVIQAHGGTAVMANVARLTAMAA